MFLTNLRASSTSILLLGLAFHLVYILSVFDCYFTSPVVHGMQHFRAGGGPAKRLVLIVGELMFLSFFSVSFVDTYQR